MRTFLKILGWGLAALVVLFVVGAIALSILYPKDKLLARLVPAAEAQLGRPVELADAGISFWPPFGIYVSGLTVANLPPARTPHLVRVAYGRGQLELWPLLSGDIVLESAELKGVDVSLERFSDSTTNISDLAVSEGGGLPILAEHFELTDFTLAYANHLDTTRLELMEVSAALHADLESLSGKLRLILPRGLWRTPVDTIELIDALTLDLQGTYDPDTDRLTIDQVDGSLGSIPLAGRATVDAISGAATVMTRLDVGPLELSSLLQELSPRLPDSLRAALAVYEFAGEVRAYAEYAGPMMHPEPGAATAELVCLGGQVRRGGIELLRFTFLRIPLDAAGFHVSGESVELLGGPLQVAAVGAWPPEDLLEATASGQIDLARAAAFSESQTVTGAIEFSASVRGPLTLPDRWSIKFWAEPRQVEIQEAGRSALKLDGGRLYYDGREVTADGLRFATGRTDLELTARIEGLEWPRLLADSIEIMPQGTVSISSRYCDLDGFFPELAVDSLPPADTTVLPPLPVARLVADLVVDTLILGGAEWRDVFGRFRLADDTLRIDTLRGRVYEGVASMAGTLDLTRPQEPGFAVKTRIDSVAVGPLLSRFGSAGRFLSGRGSLKAEIEGNQIRADELLSVLSVSGTVHLFDARLINAPAAQGTMQLLGLPARESIPLQSRWNTFHLDRGRVRLDEFEFTAMQSQWSLSGSAGLDGSLDYSLHAILSQALSEQLALPESMRFDIPSQWLEDFDPADLLKNDEGRADIFLQIRGDYLSPSVTLDWERMRPVLQERFEKRVAGKLTKEVQDQLKKGLKGLFDRKP